MTERFELLVRNGFVDSEDEVMDVGVEQGRITEIAETIPGSNPGTVRTVHVPSERLACSRNSHEFVCPPS